MYARVLVWFAEYTFAKYIFAKYTFAAMQFRQKQIYFIPAIYRQLNKMLKVE